MKKSLLVASLVAGMLGSGSVAFASDDVDGVSISPVSVSGCGTQSVSISGTGMYSDPVQHLVVTLDGTEVLHSHSEPETWSAGSFSAGVGSHTVVATIYDHMEGDGHEDMQAQDTKTFTVPSCDQGSTGGTVSSGSGSGSGDCCPGSDTEQSSVKKAGRVKGAATGKLPAKLGGINPTFEKVFKRPPTFKEWEYWANRLLKDKPTYPALYGAMQWHKLRGHTMGK
ncbi:MAG: hypothetical protein G01um1014106_615 [Parcubacteria group bacterium Gr01-1014_106]|nr:MAG: hypothetical protein G01um1014106_615 [Parcubacteria group bacterium Gr01-1014_106]